MAVEPVCSLLKASSRVCSGGIRGIIRLPGRDWAKYLSIQDCPVCQGSRLGEGARHVLVDGRSLPELTALPIDRCLKELEDLTLTGQKRQIATRIFKESCQRLSFLMEVGLSYLSLDRRAETLSGGELQRIRLASQIGAGLVGVTYVLDEPSIGLHQRDNQRLLRSLSRLRDLGNTVIVVEHDKEAIENADQVIDMGPGGRSSGWPCRCSGGAFRNLRQFRFTDRFVFIRRRR